MLSTGVETSDEARLSLVKALLSVEEETCVLEGYGVTETMEKDWTEAAATEVPLPPLP